MACRYKPASSAARYTVSIGSCAKSSTFFFQRGSTLLSAAVLGFSGLLAGCMTKPVELVEVKPVTYPQVVRTAPRNGSLFQAASYRPAFEDPRARMPGDTVTIEITEKVSATQSSSSNVDRAGSSSGGVTALPFVRPKDLLKADNLKLAGWLVKEDKDRLTAALDTIAGWGKGIIRHIKTRTADASASEEAFLALKDATFQVNQGEVVGFVGRLVAEKGYCPIAAASE